MNENSQNSNSSEQTAEQNKKTKFCKHCGEKIDIDAIICIKCGKQVEEVKVTYQQPNIVINNSSNSTNTNTNANNNNQNINSNLNRQPKDKWVALLLCLFFGVFGVHKFYEGKTGMGILYLLTGGLCGLGVFINLIQLLLKPNPYYV